MERGPELPGAEGSEPGSAPKPSPELEPEPFGERAIDPADSVRAEEDDDGELGFELDPDLRVEPVDAGAITWGSSAAAGAFAATLGGPSASDDTARPLPEIPGYDLLCVLARGGMGVVYLARSRELNRLCALKMILADEHAGPDALGRFLTEAGTAARLRHPGIVQVYRLAQYNGRPFLEMEFLDGGSLAARLDGTPWEPRLAVALMVPVAEAIAAAHRVGIVHRDVKPGNILLDADGRPKISDFGLARMTNAATGFTESGEILGSPWYMAPEQANGQTRETGPPADIHAMGAVLYELLTGRPPFKAPTILATLELVRSSPPVSPRRLVAGIPKDLDTIILHCLEKRPDARYADAAALGEDLSRFLRGESVRARPIGSLVRLGRWCGRNPLLAGLEAAVFGLLLITAVVTSLLYLRGIRAVREEAAYRVRIQEQAEDVRIALEESRANADALRVTQRARDMALYASRTNLAQAAYGIGDVPRVRQLLSLLVPKPGEPDPRGWEYDYLLKVSREYRAVSPEPDHEVAAIAYCPDGSCLATIEWGGRIALRDRRTGAISRILHAGPSGDGTVATGTPGEYRLAFSPRGDRLAAAGPGLPLGLWDVASGKAVLNFEGPSEPLLCLAIAPEGDTLAAGAAKGGLRLWDIHTGRRRADPLENPRDSVDAVAFAPDGSYLAAVRGERVIQLWDRRRPSASPTTLFRHASPQRVIAFSTDSRTLVSAGDDHAIRFWDVDTGRLITTNTRGHAQSIRALAFSADGQTLASGGSDRRIILRKAQNGQPTRGLSGHTGTILSLAFSPDGHTLASAGLDRSILLWDLPLPPQPMVMAQPDLSPGLSLAFSPGDPNLMAELNASGVHFWDLRPFPPAAVPFPEGPSGALAMAISPDGHTIAIAGEDRAVRLWSIAPPALLATWPAVHPAPIHALAFSPEGRTVASADAEGRVIFWNPATGAVRREIPALSGGALGLAFSPDGEALAVACRDGRGRLLGAETGEELHVLHGHDGIIHALAFSADGESLASAGADGLIQLWNPRTGELRETFTGHTGAVWALAFHPDGRRLASGGTDRAVHLWDLASGQELLTLNGARAAISGLRFSANGRQLAASSLDGILRLWNASPPARPLH